MSKYRPRCPIISVTRSDAVARQCHLYRGCFPLIFNAPHVEDDWQNDVDGRINWGMEEAKRHGCACLVLVRILCLTNVFFRLISAGMIVIAIQGWRSGVGHTNTMRILTVPS